LVVASEVNKVYLGRPWRAWAKSVFIRCTLPEEIAPQGWDNWGNKENESTVFFGEYKCKGAGFKPKERVRWSQQLKKSEAKRYTVKKILDPKAKKGTEWYLKQQ
jgi:pectinesterase